VAVIIVSTVLLRRGRQNGNGVGRRLFGQDPVEKSLPERGIEMKQRGH